jgi:hypothetical protein
MECVKGGRGGVVCAAWWAAGCLRQARKIFFSNYILRWKLQAAEKAWMYTLLTYQNFYENYDFP